MFNMAPLKTLEAYSIELDQIMDAETAHEYYWMGMLSDHQAFRCIVDGCNGKITCRCMKKEATKLLKRPHFQLVGVHLCETPGFQQVKTEETNDLAKSNRVQGGQDILHLTKRDRPLTPKKVHTTGPADITQRINVLIGERSKRQERDREYETILKLVTKYQEYRKHGIEYDMTIQVGAGNEMSYGELFVNLNEANFDELDQDLRIFYGDATVRAYDSGLFRINFKDTVYLSGQHRRIGALIGERSLGKRKRNMTSFLTEMSDSKVVSKVYILGTYQINEANGINYPVIVLNDDNMNYCDFR